MNGCRLYFNNKKSAWNDLDFLQFCHGLFKILLVSEESKTSSCIHFQLLVPQAGLLE